MKRLTKEETALSGINSVQDYLKVIKDRTESMKDELKSIGWDIRLHGCRDLVCTNKETICTAAKKVDDDKKLVIEKQANLADSDVYIEELGRYLALSRVYSAILEGN